MSTRTCTAVGSEYVESWPEMTTLQGHGLLARVPLPPDPVTVRFEWAGSNEVPAVAIDTACLAEPATHSSGYRLILAVSRDAFERIGGRSNLDARAARRYHLPTSLLSIAMGLLDRNRQGEAQKAYTLAKSIEILCETTRLEAAGALVPVTGEGTLSRADTRQMLDARRMIDECWAERLTLERIAKACGLNRAKLTSNFRELFNCSVTEALSEKRLAEASKLLLTTDLPVSSIGYRNGYLNNAAFSRAFARRFGVPPSSFRISRSQP